MKLTIPFLLLMCWFNTSLAQYHEALTITTDKPFYFVGDTLAFSASIQNPNDINSLPKSELLYVNLYNENQQLVKTGKFQIKNGFSNGYLPLPKNTSTNKFLLVVYTKWMLIQNNSNSYKLPIATYDNLNANNSYKTSETSTPLELYPEGGSIVSGFPNKIGFKYSFEEGASYKCFLINSKNDTVLNFNPQFEEYGYFSFLPVDTLSYEFVLKTNDTVYKKSLEGYKQKGISLRVSEVNEEYINVYVLANNYHQGINYTLTIESIGKPVLSSKKMLNGKTMTFTIPKKELNEGVIKFQLIDTEMNILSYRYYHYQEAISNVALALSDSVFKSNSNIEIPINLLSDIDDISFVGAISVVDAGFYSDTFESTKLLSSQLILNPIGPINAALNKIPSKLLDVMLLGLPNRLPQKSSNLPNVNPERINNLILLKGRVVKENSKEPFSNQTLICTVTGHESFIYSTKTGSNGEFFFYLAPPKDDASFYITAATMRSSEKLHFDLEEVKPSIENSDFLQTIDPDINVLQDFKSYKYQNKVISNNYSNFDKAKKLGDDHFLDAFFDNYGKVIDLDQYVNFSNLEEVLFELFLGIKVEDKDEEKVILVRKKDDREGYFVEPYDSKPLCLINGVPVFDHAYLLNLAVESIRFIKVIYEEVSVNNMIYQGVIEITLKEAFSQMELNKFNLYKSDYKGLTASGTEGKSIIAPIEDNEPNFTELLYWNPNFSFSEQSKSIKFYSGDNIGEYILVLKGLDGRGNIINLRKTIHFIQKPSN